jgi:peptide/nickel transport system permease protein
MGFVAGFYGGRWDVILMRLTDLMLAFPSLLLAIAVVSILGTGLINLTWAIAISSVPPFARLMRSAVLSVREEEYIQAARALGATDPRLLWIHVFPNTLATMIVQTTFSLASAVLAASGLSFLGLGVQPPTPEWGLMLSRASAYMQTAPHVILAPGLAIVLVIVSLNLVGDELRDLFDPRLRGWGMQIERANP